MDDKLFSELSLELRADYTFQKGLFIAERKYGFLKMALYGANNNLIEVIMEYDPIKIVDIVIITKEDVKRDYQKTIDELKENT